MIKKHKFVWILPYLTGLLIPVALIFQSLSFLIFVALLPEFYYIKHLAKCKLKHSLVLHIWLSGLMISLLSISWLLSTNTNNWTTLGSNGNLWLFVFIGWFLMGLTMSLPYLLLAFGIKYLNKTKLKADEIITSLILIYPAMEYIRSTFFTVASYGWGGSIGFYFNFSSLGLAVTSNPLIYSSRIVGFLGLTMLVVAVNVAVYLLFRKTIKPFVYICVSVLALSFAGFYKYSSNYDRTITATTTQISSNDAVNDEAVLNKIHALGEKTNLLVVPEYNSLFETSNSKTKELANSTVSDGGLIIYSRKKLNENTYYDNELVHKDKNLNVLSAQSKHYLIIGGEYMPWLLQQILNLSGHNDAVEAFYQKIQVNKSGRKEQAVKYGDLVVGSISCSGIVAPQLYTPLVKGGAQVLTNSASLEEFKNSNGFHDQALSFIKLQAVIHNRDFVQSAQSSFGLVVDRNGKIAYLGKKGKTEIKNHTVGLTTDTTLYDKFGESFYLISLFFATGYLLLRKRI